MADLGRRMFSQNVVIRGRLANAGWRGLLLDCIAEMRMESGGDSAVWTYPTTEGKGGQGVTICQPMTDSFMVVDTWPDHDGAYLHISSCKAFDALQLVAVIESVGLSVDRIVGQQVFSL